MMMWQMHLITSSYRSFTGSRNRLIFTASKIAPMLRLFDEFSIKKSPIY